MKVLAAYRICAKSAANRKYEELQMRMAGKTSRNCPEDWAHSKINVPASEFVMTGECSCAQEMTIDGVVYGPEGHADPGCPKHGWEAQTKDRAVYSPMSDLGS